MIQNAIDQAREPFQRTSPLRSLSPKRSSGRQKSGHSPLRSKSGSIDTSAHRRSVKFVNDPQLSVYKQQKIGEGILRNKSPSHNGQSPLRSKSRDYPSQQSFSRAKHNSPLRQRSRGSQDRPSRNAPIIYPLVPHSSNKKQSNKSLRNQYYRQINLCKKTSLNYYESATFIGYLLDMINISRRLEDSRMRLVDATQDYNLNDAFALIDRKGYGVLSQIDFRDAMIVLGMQPDRVSMDRVYLFYKRYNTDNNDNLRFCEFAQAICPLDQKYSYRLRQRRESISGRFEPHIIESFVQMVDLAIDTEVVMESIR